MYVVVVYDLGNAPHGPDVVVAHDDLAAGQLHAFHGSSDVINDPLFQ